MFRDCHNGLSTTVLARMILIIPTLGIFSRADEGPDRQAIVDSERSCFFRWNDLTVVVDHAYQGFDRLNKVKVNKTTAFFGNSRFLCDSSEIGYIRLSPNGNRLYNEKNEPVHEAMKTGLCIYTCHGQRTGEIQPVRLTHWRKISNG